MKISTMALGGAAVAAVLAGAVSGCAVVKPKREALVVGESVCASGRFDVYFVENQARLTDAAALLLSTAAAKARECDVRRVRVLGLADASGATEVNLTLSQRRARAVAEALARGGMPAPAFEVNAAGDMGATDASGRDELLRRRAEVVIEAYPR